jgi:hypothetical protein
MTVRAQYLRDGGVDLKTDEDVDNLIDAVLAQDFEYSVIHLHAEGRVNDAGFPNHHFSVGIDNEDGQVGSLFYWGPQYEGMFYAPGKRSKRPQGVFYCYQGHGEAWPQDAELPVDQIRQVVKEFVAINGDRPTSIEWRSWPSGQERGL